MKNYKLDVVRYNNEDVIATSGGIVTGPACERTDTIYKYIKKILRIIFPVFLRMYKMLINLCTCTVMEMQTIMNIKILILNLVMIAMFMTINIMMLKLALVFGN